MLEKIFDIKVVPGTYTLSSFESNNYYLQNTVESWYANVRRKELLFCAQRDEETRERKGERKIEKGKIKENTKVNETKNDFTSIRQNIIGYGMLFVR